VTRAAISLLSASWKTNQTGPQHQEFSLAISLAATAFFVTSRHNTSTVAS